MKHLNRNLYYQRLHLKCLSNLAWYWLQAAWGWHESAETRRSVMICEKIVNLVIVQNKKNGGNMFVRNVRLYLYCTVKTRKTIVQSNLPQRFVVIPQKDSHNAVTRIWSLPPIQKPNWTQTVLHRIRYGRPTLNCGSHVRFEKFPPCNLADEIIAPPRFYVFWIGSVVQMFREKTISLKP